MSGVPSQASERLVFLDVLRGGAALAVAVQHIYSSLPLQGSAVPRWLDVVGTLGGQGVAVFFVLSGCVIPYAVGTQRITIRYVVRFIARRFIRLDLPYWVCISLYLVAARVVGKHTYDDIGFGTLLANLFYVNFALELQAVVEVGWTLAIEIQFYVAYLVLLALSQRLEERFLPGRTGLSRAIVFVLPTALSLLWQLKIIADQPGPDVFFVQPWLFFFCGASLTWAQHQGQASWGVVVGVLGLFASGLWTGEVACLAGAFTGACIWWVGRRGLMSWPRAPRALLWLGSISYSLYLLHPLVGSRPVRFLAASHPAPWTVAAALGAFCAGVVVSIAVAAAFYFVVERPSQRLARRVPLLS